MTSTASTGPLKRTFEAKALNTYGALLKVGCYGNAGWLIRYLLSIWPFFLYSGYINYVLHKAAIANKLNRAETRTSAYNTGSK